MTKKPRPPPTPKQPKPWDRPLNAELGDELEDATYAAIGRALSSWERFELAMGGLFSRFLGVGGDTLPAIRAYGSVTTFRGRADMIQAASEAYFFARPHGDLSPRVASLLKEARGYSPRRNEIAHGIVRMIYGHSVRGVRELGFAVHPSDYATNKTKLEQGVGTRSGIKRSPEYVYASGTIIDFSNKFAQLRQRTQKLATLVLLNSLGQLKPEHLEP